MAAIWTGEDIEMLRALLAEGAGADEIARRLGRDAPDVEDRIRLLSLPGAAEIAFGPDEEGDVIPANAAHPDDPAAWVHGGPRN